MQLINELNIDNERRRVAEYCRQDKKRNKGVARRINKNPVVEELIKSAEQLPKPKMLSLNKKKPARPSVLAPVLRERGLLPDAYLEMNPLKVVKLLHNVRNLLTLQKQMGEDVIPRVSFFRQDDVFNLCYDRHWSTVPMLLHDLKLTRLLTLMYRARASLKTIHQKGYFQGGTQPELSCCARTRSWECSLLTGASARKFSEHHKRGKFPRRFYQDSLYSGTPKSFKVDLPTEELFIKEDQAAWLTHA